MQNSKLIDKKELMERHPAFGKKRYRLDWLVRTRKIPCVKIGRMVYFDEIEINRWLEEKKISNVR